MKPKSTFLFLVFVFCTSTCITVYAQAVNKQDSLALVDLYNSTNGPGWDAQYNWLAGPVSTWFGIEVSNRRVTGIGLSFNRLKGSIPSSIGDLASLHFLGVYSNQLNGSIPSSIGHLVNLEYLDLGSNEFSGIVPSSIGNLVNLKGLSLTANQLSGNIPSSFGNLVNLQNLDLSVNQFSDSMPSSFGNLINLQSLNLSDNQLSGKIPSSLGNLINLQSLNLGNNQLSDSIPASIGNLVNLQELNLRVNQLSGSIPPSLGNLIQLQNLALAYNQLSGSIPASLGDLANLQELSLGHNQLSGGIPASLEDLSNLQGLDLTYNQLGGGIPSSLGNLGDLQFLHLEFNQLSGSIPSSLAYLPNLEYLDLSNNQLSGSIPASLGNLNNSNTFYNLNLSNNQLSGSVPASFGNFNQRVALYLENNQLTFDGMELPAQSLSFVSYSPQANITLHNNNNSLSVSAGGTLSNNTYHWFMVGQTGSMAIKGDSVFHPSQPGKYYATITNSICTELTLHTDTVLYGVVLPVTIADLKAYRQKSIIKVEWTSFRETNITAYEIQRSSNGFDFIGVGKQAATGNGTEKTNYSFDDLQPPGGNNYYRIKVFDKDGKILYSNAVLVHTGNATIITIVYPNPANNILHIRTNDAVSFSLINQSGQVLLTTHINGTGTVDVSGFATGLYYLKNNDNGKAQKILIAR